MNKYRELAELIYEQLDTDLLSDTLEHADWPELRPLIEHPDRHGLHSRMLAGSLERRIQSIETLHDLIDFASYISDTGPVWLGPLRRTRLAPEIKATNAQWLLYGRQVGLPEQELLMLLAALSSATVQSLETLYSFDGNTVRKLGGRGLQGKASADHTVVEIWLSGTVAPGDELTLQTAICELMARSDLLLDTAEPSVRGSYYRKFKFLGLIARYTERTLQSLGSAFRSNATNYQIAAAKDLSEILKNHESAVIRVDHMIAIKVTRNGKARTLIAVLPPATQAALDSDPTLIGRPEQLLRMIDSSNVATPISSARKISKRD